MLICSLFSMSEMQSEKICKSTLQVSVECNILLMKTRDFSLSFSSFYICNVLKNGLAHRNIATFLMLLAHCVMYSVRFR